MTNVVIDAVPMAAPWIRMIQHGAECLAIAELVSILLDTESRDPPITDEQVESILAGGLLALTRRCSGSLPPPCDRSAESLLKIAAALELGRRAADLGPRPGEVVRDAPSLGRSLSVRYGHYAQERLGAIFLDTRSRVIAERVIFIGTVNSALVSTRDVLREALALHAVDLAVFHNHPSGSCEPSMEDLAFTQKLAKAAAMLDITLRDHLIVGRGSYVSMHQRGLI